MFPQNRRQDEIDTNKQTLNHVTHKKCDQVFSAEGTST